MPIQHIILAILVAAVWGFNFVIIEVGVHHISPLLLCTIRFLLTAFPAVFFFRRPATSWTMLISFGLTMFALQFGFLFAGMHMGVSAGLSALIVQTQVFFTILLAILFLNEKPTKTQIVGIILAFSGIILVGIELKAEVSILGFVFLILAGWAWSIGNLIAKKIGSVNAFALVVWGNFIAFFPMLLASCILEGKNSMFISLSHMNALTGLAIFYLVYFSTFFGYGTWNWLVKHYPIASVTPYGLLVPILGFMSSALVFGEALTWWKLLAGCLVVSGLVINVFGNRNRSGIQKV